MKRSFSTDGIRLNLELSETGELMRIRFELDKTTGNVVATWTPSEGTVAFSEGRLRDEDIGGSYPVARVAELTPTRIPDRIVTKALARLTIEEELRAQVYSRLIAR